MDKANTKRHVFISHYASPCGNIVLGAIGEALCLSDWNDMPCAKRNMLRLQRLLDADFIEADTLLTIGTTFQKRVWQALLDIPFGETRSYMQIAQSVNTPKGVRAVAQAIGANGICILVPCHRVIGSNHTLTGFAGGLEAKRTLLQLENSSTTLSQFH